MIAKMLKHLYIHFGFSEETPENDNCAQNNFSINNLFLRILNIYDDRKISATMDFSLLTPEAKKFVEKLVIWEEDLINLLKDTTVSLQETLQQAMHTLCEIGIIDMHLGDYYFDCSTKSIQTQLPNLILARSYYDEAIVQLKKAGHLEAPVYQLIGIAFLKKQQKLPPNGVKSKSLTEAIRYFTLAINARENAYLYRAKAYLENGEYGKALTDIMEIKNKFSDPIMESNPFPSANPKERQKIYRQKAKSELGKMCKFQKDEDLKLDGNKYFCFFNNEDNKEEEIKEEEKATTNSFSIP